MFASVWDLVALLKIVDSVLIETSTRIVYCFDLVRLATTVYYGLIISFLRAQKRGGGGQDTDSRVFREFIYNLKFRYIKERFKGLE